MYKDEAQKALFEKFGKLFTEDVRDPYAGYVKKCLASNKMPHPLSQFDSVLETLTDEQKTAIHELNKVMVDGVLHSLLFMFESKNWMRIQLLNDAQEVVIDDLRTAAAGDLQGYVFIWNEAYSTEELSHDRLDDPADSGE